MPFDTHTSDIRQDWNKNKYLILEQDSVIDMKEAYQNQLEACKSILKKSKTGAELLDWAEQAGIDFLVDKQLPFPAVYHCQTGIISISQATVEKSPHYVAIMMAHEIRHAIQDSKGFMHKTVLNAGDDIGDLLIAPDNMIIGTRLTEADAYAHQLQVAAELVVAGDQQGWDPIAEVTAKGNLCVVAKRFADIAMADNKTLETGEAMAEAFKAYMDDNVLVSAYNWVSLKSIANFYRCFEKKYDQCSEDERNNIKPDYGINYKDMNKIRGLGEMVNGQNYLQSLSDEYLDHSVFDPVKGMNAHVHQQYKYACAAFQDYCQRLKEVKKTVTFKQKPLSFH